MEMNDNNSGFADFINSIIQHARLRAEANKLADGLAENFDDDTILEFICWVFDRFGNKFGKDAEDMAIRFAEHFTEHYSKVDANTYETTDHLGNTVSVIFADDLPDLSGEWDETYDSDDSSLWEELDDTDESEDF